METSRSTSTLDSTDVAPELITAVDSAVVCGLDEVIAGHRCEAEARFAIYFRERCLSGMPVQPPLLVLLCPLHTAWIRGGDWYCSACDLPAGHYRHLVERIRSL